MRAIAIVLLLAPLARADASLPDGKPPPQPDDIACGSREWRAMVRGLEEWCAGERSRGCRYLLRVAGRCRRDLVFASVDDDRIRFDVRDPNDVSYAWLWTTDLDGRNLRELRYVFDDCTGP